MSEVPVTTEQVHELIQQLAAMNAAASITPQIVANIFEKMRNLNDQEREKVIAVAEAYIAEIENTGVQADHVTMASGESAEHAISILNDLLRSKMKLQISGVPGYNSSDFVSVSVTENVATVSIDYQTGSGTKLVAIKVGTVAELKNRTTYLYLTDIWTQSKCTKNRTSDWATNVITGYELTAITGGHRVSFPPAMFAGLEDTDIVYFLTGQNTFATKTFRAFISLTELSEYTEQEGDKLEEINQNVSTIQGNVSTIQGNVSTIQGNVSTIQGNVSTLQGDVSAIKETLVSNIKFPISAVPGYNSSSFISISVSDNIATIAVDYQSGSGFKIAAIQIGTVAELKNRTTYLYLTDIWTQSKCTKNRTSDWATNVITGYELTAITGGHRVSFPPAMFAGLEDTDIVYFLTGQNTFATKTFRAFISLTELSEYTEEEGNKMDGLEGSMRDLSQEVEAVSNKKIVCWGDSITMGYGGTPYCAYMKELLPDYDIFNAGVGGETISTIMARQCSDVALIPNTIVLPASKDSTVTVADGTLSTPEYLKSSIDGRAITPLLQGAGGTGSWRSDSVNPCFVNGIECQLKKVGNSLLASETSWTLQRVENGDRNITIPANTPLMFSGEKKYGKPLAAVFFCYQNEGFSDTADLIDKLQRMVKQAATTKYVIVNVYTSKNDDREAAMQAAFGVHFFNSRVYLSTNALYDLGLTPTSDSDLTQTQIDNGVKSDVYQMERGLLPSTFWRTAYREGESSKDSVHMNSYGYQALGYMLANLLKAQGL